VQPDPFELDRNVGHSVPQTPQLLLSVSRSTHVSPHKLVPLWVQAGPHRAFTHTCSLPQVRPQTPQFFLSEKRSVQVLPQRVSRPEQDKPKDIVIGAVGLTAFPFEPDSKHQEFWQVSPDGQI